MEFKINVGLYHYHEHKEHCYYHKEIDQTPKKYNILVKFEQNDDEPTLQKNFLHVMEKVKMNGIPIFRQIKKIKRPWTREEDDQLRRLVESKGAKYWAHISSFFEDRCGKQCRERWHNHLRNGIRKGEWTSEEEWIIFLGVQAYGKKWSTISKMLEGRTYNTLKNHWNCKMKPKKPSLEKRLEILLQRDNSYSLTEMKLFYIIKEKKGLKYNRVETLIKVLYDSLRYFFIVKEYIFGKNENIQQYKMSQYLKKRKFYDMYSFGSFGKSKNLEGTTRERKNNQRGDKLQYIIENDHWNEYEYALRPFELDSSDYDVKEHDMDIESSGKSSTIRHDIFYGKSESESSYEDNSEEQQEKNEGDYCDRYQVGNFSSPLKPNIFESIDLEESNQKKKLFEE